MTVTDISKYRSILESRVSELTVSARRRDGIAIEQTADDIERRLRASERELAMSGLERDSRKLEEVRAALCRIDRGAYGICMECDEPISPKRLAAVPAAALCIRCQEAFDCHCGAAGIRPTLRIAA